MREGWKPEAESKTTGRNILIAALVSAALHGAGVFSLNPDNRRAAGKAVDDISRKVSAGLNKILGAPTEDIFREELLKSGGQIDSEAFYLKMESLRGVPDSEIVRAKDEIAGLVEKFKKKNPLVPLEAARYLVDNTRYVAGSTYLSDVFNHGEGNCEAVAKTMFVVLPKLFPDLELKAQWFAGDEKGPPHVRAVAKIDAGWVALERGFPRITDKEMAGTVLTSPQVFVESFVAGAEGQKQKKSLTGGGKSAGGMFDVRFDNPPTKAYSGGQARTESIAEFERRQRAAEKAGKNPIQLEIRQIEPSVMREILSGKAIDSEKNANKDGEYKESGYKKVKLVVDQRYLRRYGTIFFTHRDQKIDLDLSDIKSYNPIRLRLRVVGVGRLDLAPLEGKKLSALELVDVGKVVNFKVVNFKAIAGMPLTRLYLENTIIEDLSPLEGAPLEEVHISVTEGMNLRPLRRLIDEERAAIATLDLGFTIDDNYIVHLRTPRKALENVRRGAREGDSACRKDLEESKLDLWLFSIR